MVNRSLAPAADGALSAARWLAAGLAVALLVTACGGSRAVVRTAPVTSVSEAITCALEEGERMGFDRVAVDREDHRVVLERTDPSVRRSDPSFQRAVDQLEIEGGREDSGSRPELDVTVGTFYEYWTRRGRVRRQRDASGKIREAADTLLNRCAGTPEQSSDPA